MGGVGGVRGREGRGGRGVVRRGGREGGGWLGREVGVGWAGSSIHRATAECSSLH